MPPNAALPHRPYPAAFTANSKTTLKVLVDGAVVVGSWTGTEGSTGLQQIPGLAGSASEDIEMRAVMEEGDYMAITEARAKRVCRPF